MSVNVAWVWVSVDVGVLAEVKTHSHTYTVKWNSDKKEFRHLNLDNVVEFLQLSKFLWNYDKIWFLLGILLSIFH